MGGRGFQPRAPPVSVCPLFPRLHPAAMEVDPPKPPNLPPNLPLAAELLATLASLGHARRLADGRYRPG